MKSRAIKILGLMIIILFACAIKSNANTLKLKTNEQEVKAGNIVEVSVNTDKNIEQTTFYLKYDKEKLNFFKSNSNKATVKNYPDDGILRVVYIDMDGEGEQKLSFEFAAKKTGVAKMEISNLTLQFVGDSTIYTGANLEDVKLDTSVKVTDLSVGMIIRIIAIILGVLVIAVIVILLIIKNKKNSK